MTIAIRPIRKKETDAVYQMFQDIPATENGAENKANGMTPEEFDNFCKLNVSYAKKEGLPPGRVPQTIYIIFNDNIPVGFGKFRPFLNEDCIRRKIGHFAFMISPKFRNKGFATQFLSFIKKEAEQLGLTEIEGGALKENLASRRTMEKNGGKIKEEFQNKVIYVIPVYSNPTLSSKNFTF